VARLVEQGDPDFLTDFFGMVGVALDVAAEEKDLLQAGGRAHPLLGERRAVEQAEQARVDAVFDQGLRRIIVDDDRHIGQQRLHAVRELANDGVDFFLERVGGDRPGRRLLGEIDLADPGPGRVARRQIADGIGTEPDAVMRIGVLRQQLGGSGVVRGSVLEILQLIEAAASAQVLLRIRQIDAVGQRLQSLHRGLVVVQPKQDLGAQQDGVDELVLFLGGVHGFAGDPLGLVEHALGGDELRQTVKRLEIFGVEGQGFFVAFLRRLEVAGGGAHLGQQDVDGRLLGIGDQRRLQNGARLVELAFGKKLCGGFELIVQVLLRGHVESVSWPYETAFAKVPRKMPRPSLLRKLVMMATFLSSAGCPSRFDPRAEPVQASPNREADHDYRQARSRLDAGDLTGAVERYQAFLVKYTGDPLVPAVKLGLARAELGLGELPKARELVEPMAGDLGRALPATPEAQRARYLLGLLQHKAHEWQKARDTLRPYINAIVAGDDAFELHAVLADAAAQLGDVDDALTEYNAFYGGARPAEKIYVRDRASALVTKLTSMEAQRLWSAVPRDSLAAAFLGRRLAAEKRAAGDLNGERSMLDDSKTARERAGLEEARGDGGRAMSVRALGCVLPLTGKGRALGERALRGALLAADLPGGGPSGGAATFELRLRDSASDPAKAAAAVDELAAEGVVAVLGSPDRADSQAASPKAERLGVPFLELARDDVRRGELQFKMVRPRAQVAATLVKRAAQSGARTIAILAPDSAYGREMAQALTDAAKTIPGLRVVADLRYPEATTTFVEPAKRLVSLRPDALIVPAAASQLALIAPQLSSLGLTKMANVRSSGKALQLYATADGANAGFLMSTGKYLQGAILAPTFYADPADPISAAFVERYRRAYNEDPSVLDALAFDAVRAARLALDAAGPRPDRAQIAAQLTRVSERGLTGAIIFEAGERAGGAPLFQVDNSALHLLTK